MTDAFGLDFIKPNTGRLPEGPQAYIYVKRLSDSQSKQSLPHITPDCVCIADIDEQINGFIKELEKIRSKAHKKFNLYKSN